MKPDWKDAPEWANWLAMDKGGSWWWYENEPHIVDVGEWLAYGDFAEASFQAIEWDESKEKRP